MSARVLTVEEFLGRRSTSGGGSSSARIGVATVATLATLEGVGHEGAAGSTPTTVARVATVAGSVPPKRGEDPTTVARVATVAGSVHRKSLHPEDARRLVEAVFYLEGCAREEAEEAGRLAALYPGSVPVEAYTEILDSYGLTYWWFGERLKLQGNYIGDWFRSAKGAHFGGGFRGARGYRAA